jgi:hypothetical protein
MEAPFDDESQCRLRRLEIGGGGLLEQRADVDRILGAAFVIAGKDLERQELGGLRGADPAEPRGSGFRFALSSWLAKPSVAT